MIVPPTGARVWLACGYTDMRKCIDGLAVAAQQVLNEDPFAGALFAFRGRRGGLIKLLWFAARGVPVQQSPGARPLHNQPAIIIRVQTSVARKQSSSRLSWRT